MDVVVTFDGLCEPKNPGGCGCWGYSIFLGTKKVIQNYGSLGNPAWMTNNYAEYCALGFALKKLVELNLGTLESLSILGDSKLVICQMNQTWQMKSKRLEPLRDKCLEYVKTIGVKPSYIWIPRHLNEVADELSRKGYDKWAISFNKSSNDIVINENTES